MRDKDLYQQILGLANPWRVVEVDLNKDQKAVTLKVEHEGGIGYTCPKCKQACKLHDHKPVRRWRHLDTCQFQTVIECRIPRTKCETDGILQLDVPWAEPGSGFTALFEALIIDWLHEASVSAISEQFGLTWDQVDGIRGRAVKRGLARRETREHKNLGLDEVSYQKHHEYATIVLDKDTDTVLEVLDDRKEEGVRTFLEGLTEAQKDAVESVSMDMWPAFIGAVRKTIPDAENKICFDHFHIAQAFTKAVDSVRKWEHKQLLSWKGESELKGSKFEWLKNSQNVDNRTRVWFMKLAKSDLKTARAWAIKEAAAEIWQYVSLTWAKKAWKKLLGWMDRSRLKPMKKVSKMIKKHLWGIMNAIRLKQDNGQVEAKNTRIKNIKRMACGFRNRQRFKEAILFHLGKLDMYPSALYPLSHPIS